MHASPAAWLKTLANDAAAALLRSRSTAGRGPARHRRAAAAFESLEGRQLFSSVAEFGLTPGSTPESMTTGPDGAVWFVESGSDKVGRITPGGTVTEFSLAAGSSPSGITAGPDGNLWFTEAGRDRVGRITTAGTVTEFSLAAGSGPSGITAGPDGNLWFTEAGHDKVGSIVPSGAFAGTISEYSLSAGTSPHGITTGADGNLWFTETSGNNIGRVTTGGSVTEFAIPFGNGSPQQIVSGPDGALYYTEAAGNRIGRVTTSGLFSAYATPASNSNPVGITVGSDNHIWISEAGADQIGRLNMEPVVADDSYAAVAGVALNQGAAGGALANDSDPEGDSLYALLSASPSYGSVVFNGDGSFTYTASAGYAGPDQFAYFVVDGQDASAPAVVNLTVAAAPVSNNDSYSTGQNTPLTVAGPGVLANDSIANGSPLSAVLQTGPANGTPTLNPDGSFTYTPSLGFAGTDTFTYAASDGTNTGNAATVTLTVIAPPVANNDAYAATEDAPLVVAGPGVLANDTDANGFPLSAALVAGPAHGTLTLNADGSFVYTPAANYNGPDSFVYRATDGQTYSAPATVTVTVTVFGTNDAPTAVADAYAATEDTPLVVAAPGILANDSDVDGDPLTAVLVSGPAHGTLTLNPNGSFVYTPAAKYNGADSFGYRASDGQALSGVVTVTLSVTPVNDAPTAAPDAYAAAEGTPLVVAAPGLLANDSDVDGDPLAAVLVTGPAHGTLTLNPNGSFTYTPAGGYHGADGGSDQAAAGQTLGHVSTVSIAIDGAPVAADDAYTVTQNAPLVVPAPAGVLANDTDPEGDPLTALYVSAAAHGTVVMNPDGSFTYTPDVGYAGPDSFGYQAGDGHAQSNVATVTLMVNVPPHAVADEYVTARDAALIEPAIAGVMSNDFDADGDPLTAVLVTGPSHGSLVLNADGSFAYTPAVGYVGPDAFSYRLNDGKSDGNTVVAAITVDAPPEATDDAFILGQDTTLTVAAPGVLGNDLDDDGDPLSAGLLTGPAHGTLALNVDGSFSYTPDAGYHGPDSFTYAAFDGVVNSDPATVSLTVDAAPVSVADAYGAVQDTPLVKSAANGVLANDTDLEGDPLSAILVAGPAHGSLTMNPDGSFVYVPTAGYHGADSFTYKATDGRATGNTVTVALTVDAIPVAAVDAYGTTVNATLTKNAAAGVLANDTDADGDALSVLLVAGPAHGTLTLNANGSFTYVPATNYSGPDSFTYRATDGQTNSAPATVTLTVGKLTPALTLATPGATMYSAGPQEATATVASVNGGGNPGSATLTYHAGTDADGTVLAGAPADVGTYTVVATYAGSAVYNPASATATYTIVKFVPTVGIAPSATRGYDANPHVATATVYGPAGAGAGTATVTYYAGTSADGEPLDGAPTAAGAYTVVASYAGDDNYEPAQVSLGFLIIAPPAVVPAVGTGMPGADVVLSPLAGAATTGGTALSASILTQPANGTVSAEVVGGVQRFRYKPAAGAFATDSFTYQVSDGIGGVTTATATINYAGAGVVSSALNPGLKDLVVVGTSGSHTITVAEAGNAKTLKVTIDGVVQGKYAVTGRVFAFARDGNDTVKANISKSVWFYGGAGNNKVETGSGADVLVGGAGNDSLNGKGGKDLVIGGGGNNTLTGTKGADLLVAGTTAYDAPTTANQTALGQILTAWTKTKSTSGLATVKSGFGGNGTPALDGSTITKNDGADVLVGTKQSWFFGDFTFNGGKDVFNDGRRVSADGMLTPLASERVTAI